MNDNTATNEGSVSLGRIAALFMLVVAIVLWSSYHLGVGPRNLGWLAPVVAAVGLASGLLGRLLGDTERARLANGMKVFLSTRFLGIGYFVALLLFCTLSSVSVIGYTPSEQAAVTIQPLDGRARRSTAEFGPNLKPADFHLVSTTPFGRSYRIDAAGYIPTTFEVYPVIGRRLRLGRDVPVAPAVLFRPPPGALGSLANDGRLFVYRIEGGKRVKIAEGADSSAFLLGRDQNIPRDVIAEWELEIQRLRDPDPATTMLKWRHYTLLSSTVALAPGNVLEAEVVSRAGVPVARASVRLRGDRLNDVLMKEVIQ